MRIFSRWLVGWRNVHLNLDQVARQYHFLSAHDFAVIAGLRASADEKSVELDKLGTRVERYNPAAVRQLEVVRARALILCVSDPILSRTVSDPILSRAAGSLPAGTREGGG